MSFAFESRRNSGALLALKFAEAEVGMDGTSRVKRLTGWVGVIWGIGGLAWTLAHAIFKLLPLAVAPLLEQSMAPHLALAYVGCVVLMAYTEGYRGFQRSFSPAVAQRAGMILQSPTFLRVLFAPAFCMGLWGVGRRKVVASWLLLAMIVGFIHVVRYLPPIWRGAIDAGVVVGLSWGPFTIGICVAGIRPGDKTRDLPTFA
jgi:hypothetical protein